LSPDWEVGRKVVNPTRPGSASGINPKVNKAMPLDV
jgi:hypothetical protein